jgi:NitT/TauT family transport system substrate-binding protein
MGRFGLLFRWRAARRAERWRVMATALALALAAGGARAEALEHVNLATAGISLFNYLPATLAERIGAFREQGLEVSIKDFQGGQKSIESLVGGTVDFAVATYDNAIFLQTKGIAIVNVVLINRSLGGVIAISAKRRAGFRSAADLKGALFGVSSPGSATNRMLNVYLIKNGLKPTDVSVQGIGGGAGAVAVIQSGRLDGFVHSEPVVSQALKGGQMSILVDARTEEGMNSLYGGYLAATTVLTTPAVIKNRPEVVQRFVNAMVSTLKWMRSTPPDEIMSRIPTGFFGNDPQMYRSNLVDQLPVYSTDGQLTLEPIERTLKSMYLEGALRPGQAVDLARTFDNSFAQRANP